MAPGSKRFKKLLNETFGNKKAREVPMATPEYSDYELDYRLSHPGEDSDITIPYLNFIKQPKFKNFMNSLLGIDKYKL